MSRWRIASILVFSLVGVGALGAAMLTGGGARARASRASSATRASLISRSISRTTRTFAFLARQTSNSCGLEPTALATMPDRMRLQGSCCFPMNRAAYRGQVRGLRAYSNISAIPQDPYDVPISLAKRLLDYDQTIRLNPAGARTYARAMRMSSTKGPCCCGCWRWYAFRGLSKYLIADLAWRPAAVAAVIDLVEGCGGPTETA